MTELALSQREIRARTIRARLRNPPNAVPDSDIDLGRQSAAARAALDELRLYERTEVSYKTPPKVAPRFWTDERCADLVRLWPTDASVKQIAKTIGAVSRGAVSAKAHVLGLPSRCRPRKKEVIPVFDVSRPAGVDGLRAIARIQEVVASAYGLSRNTLISHRRGNVVIRPRHVAIYLCAELTPASFPAIGRMFANRDHTTILHAHHKITRLRRTDAKLDAEIIALTEKLGVMGDVGA